MPARFKLKIVHALGLEPSAGVRCTTSPRDLAYARAGDAGCVDEEWPPNIQLVYVNSDVFSPSMGIL